MRIGWAGGVNWSELFAGIAMFSLGLTVGAAWEAGKLDDPVSILVHGYHGKHVPPGVREDSIYFRSGDFWLDARAQVIDNSPQRCPVTLVPMCGVCVGLFRLPRDLPMPVMLLPSQVLDYGHAIEEAMAEAEQSCPKARYK